MSWLTLALAIIAELGGTMSLKMASGGSKRWIPSVVAGYGIAFAALGWTLHLGMPVGIAYGVWAASGVVLAALLGKVLFNEPFTWIMGLGVAAVVGGLLLIEFGHPNSWAFSPVDADQRT
jgi:small multidrug resistance pump